MNLLKVIFWSAVPLAEQRLAIPLGIITYDMNPFVVFIVSFLGSNAFFIFYVNKGSNTNYKL